MRFKPFYVYKCFTELPIVYLFPQKLVDWFVRKRTTRPFYEYYFEPTGQTGMVFFQFMDNDFEKGMQTKKEIEQMFAKAQIVFYILIVLGIYLVGFSEWSGRNYVGVFILLLWLTRFLNPITANYNLYKAQKQSIFGGGPTKNVKEEIETFDTGVNPHTPLWYVIFMSWTASAEINF